MGSMFCAFVVGKGLRMGGLGLKGLGRTEGKAHAPDPRIQFEMRVSWLSGACGTRSSRGCCAPSHVEEGWGRFRPGPHVAAARWVGRGCAVPGGPAGSTCGTKAPPPTGGGAPRGGAERRLRPSLRGPQPSPPGSLCTPRGGLTSVPRTSKGSLEGSSVARLSTTPFLIPRHLLRLRSRFRAVMGWDWRKRKNWFQIGRAHV